MTFMTVNEAKRKLAELQRKQRAYRHATSLLYYDGVTTAPRGTAANRGETLSILSGIQYELLVGRETSEILATLDAHREMLDGKTCRIVDLMLKSLRETRCIPQEEYVAYQTLLNEADDVWHRAKEENDYAAFEPYLAQIIETNIRFAGYIAPDKHPCDYWLDQYEGGLTMEKCDTFFAALRERIVPLVRELKRLRPGVVLSVDTRKSAVARAVLELGVEIINDVSLLRYDPALARTVAEYGAALVLCHSRGTPENMRSGTFCVYPEGVVAGVMRELSPAAESAEAAGVRPENIIYDPGIGFAKTPEQDWTLLREIGKFRTLGPVLAGISRKSFLGAFLDQKEPQLRLGGTLAGVLYLADAGVEILRVHDVRQAGDALRVHWKLREGK